MDEERRRREEAEQQRQRQQQRAEEAEEQTRKNTLSEYIEACHELLFKNFVVETDKSLTPRGSITNPQNKWCPTRLSVSSDFLELQKTAFGRLYSTQRCRKFNRIDKIVKQFNPINPRRQPSSIQSSQSDPFDRLIILISSRGPHEPLCRPFPVKLSMGKQLRRGPWGWMAFSGTEILLYLIPPFSLIFL